nr:hypothetical protein [Escherichia coli]
MILVVLLIVSFAAY